MMEILIMETMKIIIGCNEWVLELEMRQYILSEKNC